MGTEATEAKPIAITNADGVLLGTVVPYAPPGKELGVVLEASVYGLEAQGNEAGSRPIGFVSVMGKLGRDPAHVAVRINKGGIDPALIKGSPSLGTEEEQTGFVQAVGAAMLTHRTEKPDAQQGWVVKAVEERMGRGSEAAATVV